MRYETDTESTVVVGVDGSASCLEAVAFAAREAQLRTSRLLLVHAFVWPLLGVADGAGPGIPGLRANAEQYLASAAEIALRTAPDVTLESRLVEGWPVPVLTNTSAGASLAVLGSHGCGRVVAGLVGSTAIELSVAGHAPLVVVRPTEPQATPALEGPIVVGVDGSVPSLVAARFAAVEAALVGTPLHVAQIRPSPRDEVAARLLVDDLRDSNPRLDVEFRALSGHPADELIEATRYARMVVVGTRGRSGIAGLVLGSVSHALLEHGAGPVAVMPRRYVEQVAPSSHRSRARGATR